MRFTKCTFTTKWQTQQKGIVAGYSSSVILIIIGLNMKIKSGKKLEAQKYQLTVGNNQIEGLWTI